MAWVKACGTVGLLALLWLCLIWLTPLFSATTHQTAHTSSTDQRLHHSQRLDTLSRTTSTRLHQSPRNTSWPSPSRTPRLKAVVTWPTNLPPGRDGCFVVPNLVHSVRLGRGRVSFVEAVCLLAALKHQQPRLLMIHAEVRPRGPYWQAVVEAAGKRIKLMKVSRPTQVFGQQLSRKWLLFHGGDVLRLRVLRTYGGIFIDSDAYIVRSLDQLRRYNMSLGWCPGKDLQNQVIVAHKDAEFLRLWLLSYKNAYDSEKFYYNAGHRPTAILEARPELVHREETLLGNYNVFRKIYQTDWKGWRSYYAIHLLARHTSHLTSLSKQATYPVIFTEKNIHRFPVAFRDMVYEVFPFKGRFTKTFPATY